MYERKWIVPNGEYTNQIGHVLVHKQYQRVIGNIKPRRSGDINSDRFCCQVEYKDKEKSEGQMVL